MNIQLIIYMVLSLAVVMPIVGYIIHIIDRKDKIKVNTGAAMYVRQAKGKSWYPIFLMFSRFVLTRNYFAKISRRYEVICPGEPRVIAEKTMKVAMITFALSVIELIFLFGMKPNLINGILCLFLVFVIQNEVINHYVNKAEIKLLEEIAVFISEVRHNYYINRMVDDAILMSMNGLSYDMKVHANKLYEIVISTHIKEEVVRYNTTMHNRYLKMFLSLCISILEFSDKKINNQSLYTLNLENLKKEINIEILKLKKLRYLFSGVTFVTIVACIPLDAIKKFGISMLPELDGFYNGRVGIIFVFVIILVTVIIYILNNRLKDSGSKFQKDYRYLNKIEKLPFIKKALNNYMEKHYGKTMVLNYTLQRIGERISPRQLLLQRILVSVTVFLCSIVLALYLHENNRVNITSKVNNNTFSSLTTNASQNEMISEAILNYVELYKVEEITQEQILDEIWKEHVFYQAKINETIAEEVITRVNLYQLEYFKWYEMLISTIISTIAFFVPYWMIMYKKKILLMSMEDEVNQFNSIIFMLMFIEHLTVKELLEEIELFAVVFKQSIQECINSYNSGDIEALEKLKERETYGPFQRLVDNFIRCDILPLDKAFDEIASDRENYHDRRKQENEMSVQKRADIAKPLSFIPIVFVMGYLILPLLMASLKELQVFSEMMKGI